MVDEVKKCRICGSTEDDYLQRMEKTGKRCYWVEKDLCSGCKAIVVALASIQRRHRQDACNY